MQAELFPVTSDYKDVPVKDLPDFPGAMPTAQMVASIKRHGVLEPILMRGNTVLAGRRRIKAARIAGRETIPARIFPEDALIANDHIIALVENEQRRSNPLSDLKSVESLLEQGLDENAICLETGITKQRLRKILITQKLIPHLRRAFEDGVIRYTVAALAAKKPEAVQNVILKRLEVDGTLKLKDVHAICKVQRKKAVQALPDDLFGSVVPKWKPDTIRKLQDVRKLTQKDADAEWLEKLDKLIEELE
jgi:ParB/RepB/Spo0J family partition protein